MVYKIEKTPLLNPHRPSPRTNLPNSGGVPLSTVAATMSWTSILRHEWGETGIEMRCDGFAPLSQVLARLRKTQGRAGTI